MAVSQSQPDPLPNGNPNQDGQLPAQTNTAPTAKPNTSEAGTTPKYGRDYGTPLHQVTGRRASTLRDGLEKLWSLLDDIDTVSDAFKPSDEQGYRKFYEYTMSKVKRRHSVLESDGYKLYLPQSSSDAE
jgi:hypothetical protein